jgi:hypothetical protein
MKISVTLIKQEDGVIANCPELEISCYASNATEATNRIKKVISFYIDSARDMGIEVQDFDEVLVDGQYAGSMRDYSTTVSDVLN